MPTPLFKIIIDVILIYIIWLAEMAVVCTNGSPYRGDAGSRYTVVASAPSGPAYPSSASIQRESCY